MDSRYMDERQRTRLSKLLSATLRHHPEILNIVVLPDGFADHPLNEIAQFIRERRGYYWVTDDHIREIVQLDPKERFEILNERIRAKYGHSINVHVPLKPTELPAMLYHGTTSQAYSSIKKKGLLPMGRKYVHLTSSIQDARKVASRKGKNVILLEISSKELDRYGYEVKKAGKTIYIVTKVPPDFLSIAKIPRNI
ncbi:MAG: RNA 2'-phosphotransferase [Promethearchaeota archaeon]